MKHHPQGPSRQKNYDECCGFIPTINQHENKILGNVCHRIWDTGDKSLADELPDPAFALGLVTKLNCEWWNALAEFTSVHGKIVVEENEVFLDVPGLNFGTCDRLRIAGKAALIGDAKFGNWKVEHAQDNLQGYNYAVLVWELYPAVEEVRVWFGNPRLDDYTLAKFTRRDDYPVFRAALVRRLADARNPDPKKFHYDELNCSFCSRLECPVRNKVAAQVVDYLGDKDSRDMTLEELNNIKKLTNSLKTLTKRVDDEAKERVLDKGEALSDFVIKERVHSREIISLDHIDALRFALAAYGLPEVAKGLDDIVSVPFSDVEQLIVHNVGSYRQARPIISKLVEELEAARALTTNKYYIVAAKNESEK